MTNLMLEVKTRANITEAKYRIESYEKQDTEFLKGALDHAQEDLEYYQTIEKILKKIPKTLERWKELLQTDGTNSKSMVLNDIQYLLQEIGK